MCLCVCVNDGKVGLCFAIAGFSFKSLCQGVRLLGCRLITLIVTCILHVYDAHMQCTVCLMIWRVHTGYLMIELRPTGVPGAHHRQVVRHLKSEGAGSLPLVLVNSKSHSTLGQPRPPLPVYRVGEGLDGELLRFFHDEKQARKVLL